MESPPKDNLGKRHHALNERVNKAAAKRADFEEITHAPEKSAVDKLFKIDLAARYKHTDFIIETLKSGNSLYITRAINKSSWLFDEEHIDVINPTYLHSHVFKLMSDKMMKKFLTAISNHVRTEKRATDFYHYCIENDLTNIGLKFLLFTADDLKKGALLDRNHRIFEELMKKDEVYIKHLIGKSFILLEAYLATLPDESKYNFVFGSRYLYVVNGDKYIETLENCENMNDDDNDDIFDYQYYWQKFNVKFSKNIMMKHKERVLGNPKFFLRRLDSNILMKHITTKDAKLLAVACLPSNPCDFWDKFYYRKHRFFLNLIPHEEMYAFLKKIFNDQYPNEEFEMSPWFFNQDFHLLMTTEEREKWALEHVRSEKEIECHNGNVYSWYEFVNFDRSFEAIKQMIVVTTDQYIRNDMVNVLMRSTRNNRELEKVFNYYNEQISDTRQLKDSFLHNVIREKNVFEFDEDCWTAFYKFLLSMELFNTEDLTLHNNIYKTITLLYEILYREDIDDRLKDFLSVHFSYPMINTGDYGHYNKLSDEKREIVYSYLYKYYVDKVSACKDELFTIRLSSRLKRYFQNITGLMRLFREEVVNEEPGGKIENEKKHLKKIKNIYMIRDNITDISDRGLLRRLKRDTELVTSKNVLSRVKNMLEEYPLRINNFLKKIKIYFYDDIRLTYLNLFSKFILKLNLSTQPAVFAILELCDEETKIELIEKYTEQKFTTKEVEERTLDLKLRTNDFRKYYFKHFNIDDLCDVSVICLASYNGKKILSNRY